MCAAPRNAFPYPLVATDLRRIARADADAENQTCACGNDSQADGWVALDVNGAMDFTASGSADGREYTLCPVCGRVFSNADLITGRAVPVASCDTTAPQFLAALSQYNHDAYGDTNS